MLYNQYYQTTQTVFSMDVDTDSLLYPDNKDSKIGSLQEPEDAISNSTNYLSGTDASKYINGGEKTRQINGKYVANVYLTKDVERRSVTQSSESEAPEQRYDTDEDIPDVSEMSFEDYYFQHLVDVKKEKCTRCNGSEVSDCVHCGGDGYNYCSYDRCEEGIVFKDCEECYAEWPDYKKCKACNDRGKVEFGVCPQCSNNDYPPGNVECEDCDGAGESDCRCEQGIDTTVILDIIKISPTVEQQSVFDDEEIEEELDDYVIENFSSETYPGFPPDIDEVTKSNIDGEIIKTYAERGDIIGYELEVKTDPGNFQLIVSRNNISQQGALTWHTKSYGIIDAIQVGFTVVIFMFLPMSIITGYLIVYQNIAPNLALRIQVAVMLLAFIYFAIDTLRSSVKIDPDISN